MADEDAPLAALRGISDAACKLIDTVGKGIGVLYEPTRIRRKAEAEADAMVILAKAKGRAVNIASRAGHRIAYREIRRQENLESIVRASIRELPDNVSQDLVDEDWVRRFLEYCQDISDSQMQALWARILAGEVAQPGQFSLRALDFVRLLAKNEAHQFTRFCSYVWRIGTALCHPITVEGRKYLAGRGYLYDAARELEEIGLLRMSPGVTIKLEPNELLAAWYFDEPYTIERTEGGRNARFEVIMLTKLGCELAPICGAEPDTGFRDIIIASMASDGFSFTAKAD